MTYDGQILQILTDVGEKGIGVQQLAKHVYNINCTLFSQPDLQQIHKNNADARQLMLEFRETRNQDGQEIEEKPQTDYSLSLFD